ncbi:MAG: DUF559 domain-containing protein [Acidimicrobiales bacterium]
MPRVDWPALARLASSRYGLIRDADAAEHVTPKQLRTLLQRGELERPYAKRQVLRVAGSPWTPEQALLAAVWAGGWPSAASHRSAAKLFDLVDDWPPNPEITVPSTRLPRLARVDVHRSDILRPQLLTTVGHIKVTNPFLTLVQLGAVGGEALVAAALERAFTKRLVTPSGLRHQLDLLGAPGRSGAGVLRSILKARVLGDVPADSELEVRMAQLLVRHDLPPATYHHVILDDAGHFVAEVDYAYVESRVALEVDGWSAHGTPQALGRDLERQADIEELGWLVRRFTWWDVNARPEYVARRIETALRTRGALLGQ